MATIIFDFDDTLFDSTKLKKDIFNVLKDFNIKEEHIQETYISARCDYTFENHIEIISKYHKDIDTKEILTNLNKVDFSKYILPDVENILEELNKKHTLILVTFGEKNFQTNKLQKSGIAKYFESKHIHITQNNKIDVIKNLTITDEVYFINDKITENESIQKEFPHFKYFLVSKENPVPKIIKQI